MRAFGKQLHHARTAKGMTRKEVADAAGVHESNIYNWERRGMLPRVFSDLSAVAEVVGMRPSHLA
jgi:transcriptional regulator with XRE-family HTH domain